MNAHFTADGNTGGKLMRLLDTMPGWDYRGSHGVFFDTFDRELWGYAYAGPNGEYVSIDFTRNTRTGCKTAFIAGLPACLQPQLCEVA